MFVFFLQEHDVEGQKQNGEKPRENKVLMSHSTTSYNDFINFIMY